jgi:hypothetical protein
MEEGQYPHKITLREKHVKNKIHLFCIHEGTEGTKDYVRLESFHYGYTSIYGILQKSLHPKEKTHVLNHLKAKIARINSKRFQSLPLDTPATTLFQGEQPSIFNLLNMQIRRV